jgi:hypothetical protein
MPVVGAALFLFSRCTAYWRDRAEDFADIGPIFSKKPQLVLYHSFESIVALGYADYEATFVGWGEILDFAFGWTTLDFLVLIQKAGFVDVELVGFTGYRTSPSTIGALIRARKP